MGAGAVSRVDCTTTWGPVTGSKISRVGAEIDSMAIPSKSEAWAGMSRYPTGLIGNWGAVLLRRMAAAIRCSSRVSLTLLLWREVTSGRRFVCGMAAVARPCST
jgi:hypothetical protein